MKFDMGRAWSDATRMLKANRELVLVLAGLFFFVPYLAAFLSIFGSDFSFIDPNQEPNPEQMTAKINEFLLQYWWAFLLIIVGQLIGSIALLKVLAAPERPTVGQAVASVPRFILAVIAAQIITAIIVQIIPSLAELLPPSLAAIAGLISLPITIYLSVKFSLVSATVVLGEILNPIRAIRRSWNLTKGSSFGIFGFYVLLFLAGLVLFAVVGMVIGVVFALMPDRGSSIGWAIYLAIALSAFNAVSFCVVASIYGQLADESPESLSQTFD